VDEVWCARLGQVPYEEARDLQRALAGARHAGEVSDVLLLLEHPPVYTKGRRADPSELAMGEDWYRSQGIEVAEADRGGAVTYHGPGQVVGYPIVSLKPYGDDVRGYVARMERVMISSLSDAGVEAQVIDGLTGVWTAGAVPTEDPSEDAARKIGSIGIHVSRGVTTHGFAINVSNDLQPFEWIVPCGIEGVRMTSVSRELGETQEMEPFMDVVSARFASTYERELRPVDPAELPGVGAPVS
jgi:lipoyl(octanoyl) transferase